MHEYYNKEREYFVGETKKIKENKIFLKREMAGMIPLGQLIEHGAFVATANYTRIRMESLASAVKRMLILLEASWKISILIKY